MFVGLILKHKQTLIRKQDCRRLTISDIFWKKFYKTMNVFLM